MMVCGCSRVPCCPRVAHLYGQIHERGVADTLVKQVHVGPQGEPGVGVPEPLLHLASHLARRRTGGMRMCAGRCER